MNISHEERRRDKDEKRYIFLAMILCLGILLTACRETIHTPTEDVSPENEQEEVILGQKTHTEEKPQYGGSLMLGGWSINSLIDNNVCAFYGKITGKSEEVFEHIRSPQASDAWLYHEVYVEVLECWQTMDDLAEGDTFTYRELGGENEQFKFTVQGVPIYSVGDYVIVLAHENTFVTGDRVMKVEDGIVTPWPSVLSDLPSVAAELEKENNLLTFTVEEFAALVKEAQEN